MNKSAVCLTAVFILVIGAGSVFGQSEEAKRHFDYGMAAAKMEDFEAAVKEFEQAARLAPNWPDAFYNLGLAQEGTKKYGDAAKSYREYLQLAPNASDAEEVKSLINKLEYMAIPVPEIAKGFMGIPWGANPEQIIEAMNGQGYQLKSQSENSITFANLAGGPLRHTFLTKDNALYHVETNALVRSGNPQVARAVFRQKYDELSEKYGPPQAHNSKINKAPIDGHDIPFEAATWKIIDSRTSITYYISLVYDVGWWTDTGSGDQYMVNVINKKDTKKPSEASPSINTEDTRKPSVTPSSSKAYEREAERLIAEIGGINAKDSYGATPLHRVCSFSYSEAEVAGILITKGADVNAKTDFGKTPLHNAAVNGNRKLAELLIAKGADINAKDKDGDTPLHEAAMNRGTEATELLIAKGADINAKDEFGRTPLDTAANINNIKIAELLIAKGADVNAKDMNGRTPLHTAAGWSEAKVTELLINGGADVNAKDTNGYTPLHVAASYGKTEVAEILIAKGADINARNKYGDTPLYEAKNMSKTRGKAVRKEMIDLLKKHGGK
jgi:ankyrin repeat protein